MSIPSFSPIGDYLSEKNRNAASAGLTASQRAVLAAAAKVPAIPTKPTGLGTKSIANLHNDSKEVRYVDFARLSYKDLLAPEVADANKSPIIPNAGAYGPGAAGAPDAKSVLVIGQGIGGLMCSWQLAKAKFKVEAYEVGWEPGDLNQLRPDNANLGAGRIDATHLMGGFGESFVGELGAMRFPDSSHIFWHYISLMKRDVPSTPDLLMEFPNVGKIPTAFFGQATVYPFLNGKFDLPTAPTLDQGIDYRRISRSHMAALLGIADTKGLTLGDVAEMIGRGSLGAVDIQRITEFWREMKRRYYNVSYVQFLRSAGFNEADIEVIGYIGLGTGGFKPLFDVCVLEILRLIPWNYQAEYSVPNLYRLPMWLKDKAISAGARIMHRAEVVAVFFSRLTKKYLAIYRSTSGAYFYSGLADYVVFAMTTQATAHLFSRTDFDAAQVTRLCPDPIRVGALKENGGIFNANDSLLADIREQQGMPAVKVFSLAFSPAKTYYSITFATVDRSDGYDKDVRAWFGKQPSIPVGVHYMLPATAIGDSLKSGPLNMLLNYLWGKDALEFVDKMITPKVSSSNSVHTSGKGKIAVMDYTGDASPFVTALSQMMWEQQKPKVVAPGIVSPSADCVQVGFHKSDLKPVGNAIYTSMVNWSKVPFIWTGFKLDTIGRGQRSIFAYKSSALSGVTETNVAETSTGVLAISASSMKIDQSLKRCYFAGDAYSNMGGWCEGAFQSALAVCSSIAYDYQVRWWGVPSVANAMNPEARFLVEDSPDPFSLTL